MTLGEKIVYYRDKRGLTQKALAERMGITPTRLNYWEKDKREPDVKMLNLLCKTLEIDPKALLSDEGTEKAPALSEDSTRAISVEALETMLIQGGFIRPGEDLSDDDLDFLLSVGRIVETWFRKRQKHGGE